MGLINAAIQGLCIGINFGLWQHNAHAGAWVGLLCGNIVLLLDRIADK